MSTDLYTQPGVTPDFNRLNPSPTVARVIGLWGYAGAGKDTVGGIITNLYGHQRASFADVLRSFILAQDLYMPTGERVNDVIKTLGWETAKREHAYLRELQQNTGTNAGRQILGENVWVEAAFSKLTPGGSYVFTDCRFPNEAQRVKDSGGIVVSVVRPGCSPINGHTSETALENWDFDAYILNDGSVLDLQGEVMAALGDLP